MTVPDQTDTIDPSHYEPERSMLPVVRIADRERRTEAATAMARRHQAVADELIAAELASGKTYRQQATETGTTQGHLRAAKRRFERRKAESRS
jgi:hypothetical protein